MSTRILLVDDHLLFRQGVAALLASQPDLSVVGDVRGGKEAVLAALSMDPDMIMMDIMQIGVCGIDTVAQIKQRQPQIRVILLTSLRTRDYVRAALGAGADGYVLKDANLEELLMAIRSVAAGKMYLSPEISCFLVDGLLHPERNQARSSKLELLNNRERSILQLVAEGRTNRSTGEYLNLSPKTVEKYRASLMSKLGLRNATELTLTAMELGLIARPTSHWQLSDHHARGKKEGSASGDSAFGTLV
jgi:DNA-binding NarL/FixJ family response regulator